MDYQIIPLMALLERFAELLDEHVSKLDRETVDALEFWFDGVQDELEGIEEEVREELGLPALAPERDS